MTKHYKTFILFLLFFLVLGLLYIYYLNIWSVSLLGIICISFYIMTVILNLNFTKLNIWQKYIINFGFVVNLLIIVIGPIYLFFWITETSLEVYNESYVLVGFILVNSTLLWVFIIYIIYIMPHNIKNYTILSGVTILIGSLFYVGGCPESLGLGLEYPFLEKGALNFQYAAEWHLKKQLYSDEYDAYIDEGKRLQVDPYTSWHAWGKWRKQEKYLIKFKYTLDHASIDLKLKYYTDEVNRWQESPWYIKIYHGWFHKKKFQNEQIILMEKFLKK